MKKAEFSQGNPAKTGKVNDGSFGSGHAMHLASLRQDFYMM
jgi:hypothetical protein